MDISQHIRKVPDFPKKGILFYDFSTLLINPEAWRYTVNKIVEIAKPLQPDLIAGIEARGFLISSSVALSMNIGSILIRKKGKTPSKNVVNYTYNLEYGTDTLEINKDIIQPNKRILIVDDVLATGGTINATVELIKKVSCIPIGAICILELLQLKGREQLSIPVHPLVQVD